MSRKTDHGQFGEGSLAGKWGRGLLQGDLLQGNLFLCDVFDAIPKDDIASMEHPLFSLSTRPDRRILHYSHNGTQITVTPSVRGLATIHDKDILIFCISQLMAALNGGRALSRTLTLRAHDLLVATNRQTSGDAYRRLREAFERLAGTRITTNIVTGEHQVTSGFGLIEGWEIVRKTPRNSQGGGRMGGGRMVSVRVTLSEWLYRAVLSKSVLTLSRDYFRLRKPLERRVYELARKHCGRQASWTVSVDTLLKKSGSASPRRVFRKMLRDMIGAETLPDYHMQELPGDLICFSLKGRVLEGAPVAPPVLSSQALEAARGLMPGWDVYALEAAWREVWQRSGGPRLRQADAAFLGWVKKRAGRAGP